MSNTFSNIAHRLYTGEVSYDFVARRNRWYLISAAAIALSLLALLIRGLNLGIEFKGGADFQAPIAVTATTVDDVRNSVKALGLPSMDDINVTTIGDNQVRVQTRSLTVEEVTTVKQAIATTAKTQSVDDVAYSLIGASWGEQITGKALLALGVFLVLVMAMIWVYFRDFKMSVSAIVALLHDLIITVGIYALVGFTVTPATMIGVLTILGYSLYDTVVVFDKVRENVRNLTKGRETYSEAANRALNQVLVRSLNTTIIGVLPVAALLFAGAFILGVGPLKDLGLALFVGMVAGAYSSIFIATPLLAQMTEYEPEMVEHRARLARRATRAAATAPKPATTVKVSLTDDGKLAPAAAEDDTVAEEPVVAAKPASMATKKSGGRSQPARNNRSSRRR